MLQWTSYSCERASPVLSRSALSLMSLALVIAACSSSHAGAGELNEAHLTDVNITVKYPSDWYLAEQSLTPNLGNPHEVLSVGSFPLNSGGPNCAQIPSQALGEMTATDVFVTVQERGADAIPAGFAPRPDEFGPIPGSTQNELYECVDEAERADIDAIHWIWFRDQDRFFHVAVAIGEDAAPEDVAAAWKVLDDLIIEPTP